MIQLHAPKNRISSYFILRLLNFQPMMSWVEKMRCLYGSTRSSPIDIDARTIMTGIKRVKHYIVLGYMSYIV